MQKGKGCLLWCWWWITYCKMPKKFPFCVKAPAFFVATQSNIKGNGKKMPERAEGRLREGKENVICKSWWRLWDPWLFFVYCVSWVDCRVRCDGKMGEIGCLMESSELISSRAGSSLLWCCNENEKARVVESVKLQNRLDQHSHLIMVHVAMS